MREIKRGRNSEEDGKMRKKDTHTLSHTYSPLPLLSPSPSPSLFLPQTHIQYIPDRFKHILQSYTWRWGPSGRGHFRGNLRRVVIKDIPIPVALVMTRAARWLAGGDFSRWRIFL